MKTILIHLTDEEYAELKTKKKNRTWKEMLEEA